MAPFLYPDTSPHLRCYNEHFEQALLFLEFECKTSLKELVHAFLYSGGPKKMGDV